MKERCRKYVEVLPTQSSGLQATHDETVEHWRPDEPPVTTGFAALDDRIIENFESVGVNNNRQLFQLIETAMCSGDNDLETVDATGLIETIIARSWRQEGLWKCISPMLGDQSRKYASAWLAWSS